MWDRKGQVLWLLLVLNMTWEFASAAMRLLYQAARSCNNDCGDSFTHLLRHSAPVVCDRSPEMALTDRRAGAPDPLSWNGGTSARHLLIVWGEASRAWRETNQWIGRSSLRKASIRVIISFLHLIGRSYSSVTKYRLSESVARHTLPWLEYQ